MARLALVAAVVGLVATAGAAPPADDVERTWCFTYLSTYLEPVSFGSTIAPANPTVGPAQSPVDSASMTVSASTVPPTGSETFATSAESEGTSSALPTSALIPGSSIPTESIQTSASKPLTTARGTSVSSVPSTTVATSAVSGSFAITPSSPAPTTSVIPGNRVIFLIAPAPPERTKRIRKRDLGGFVSTGLDENPPTCDQASVFILSDAQELLIGETPLYYDAGDSFRQLRSTSNPPAGAVTRGFTIVNGLLVFQNPALPDGEASFCQDATSGQAYIVFTSGPSGCVPVNIVAYDAEQCQNGQIVSASTVSSNVLQTHTSVGPSNSQSTPGSVSTGVIQTARPPTTKLNTQSSQISVASSNLQLSSLTTSQLPPVSSTAAGDAQISLATFRTLSLFFPNTTLQEPLLSRTTTQATTLTPVPSSSSPNILAPEPSQRASSTFISAVSQISPSLEASSASAPGSPPGTSSSTFTSSGTSPSSVSLSASLLPSSVSSSSQFAPPSTSSSNLSFSPIAPSTTSSSLSSILSSTASSVESVTPTSTLSSSFPTPTPPSSMTQSTTSTMSSFILSTSSPSTPTTSTSLSSSIQTITPSSTSPIPTSSSLTSSTASSSDSTTQTSFSSGSSSTRPSLSLPIPTTSSTSSSSSSSISSRSSSSSSSSAQPSATGCTLPPPVAPVQCNPAQAPVQCSSTGPQAVRLSNPTRLAPNDIDDGYATVNLPFSIGVNGSFSTVAYVCVNGLISIDSPSNGLYPVRLPSNVISKVSILTLQKDLIDLSSPYGLYYQISPSSRTTGRQVTFEYVISSIDLDGNYHFATTFYENLPGVVSIAYYQVPDMGASASIGIQNLDKGLAYQYSFETASVYDGTSIEFDTSSCGGTTYTCSYTSPVC